ncbi:hypothetical protein JRQ81_002420, partial [Phrynocephalus forsythii]
MARSSSIKDDLAMVKKVEAVILDKRRSTMERVIVETGLSYGSVWRIIHEELHMIKVCAFWVPCSLTALQKQTRHDFSQQNLTLLELQKNEDNFFARFITMDECWVYLYNPESKEMSKEWKHPSPPSQEGEGTEICWEGDAVCFWRGCHFRNRTVVFKESGGLLKRGLETGEVTLAKMCDFAGRLCGGELTLTTA